MVIDDGLVKDLGYSTTYRSHVKQFDGAVHVVRAHHHIDVRGFLANYVFIFLGQAPCNNNLAIAAKGFAGFFPGLQPAKCSVQFFVGVFANATGVQHHNIGVVFVFGHFHAVLFEQAGNPLGVVRIHLAPKGAHYIFTSHSGSSLPP